MSSKTSPMSSSPTVTLRFSMMSLTKFIREICLGMIKLRCKNMKKKILVTGGAGFIGSHLCERLAQNQNFEIFSLDNYFTGSESNHVANVTYIRGDTANIASL